MESVELDVVSESFLVIEDVFNDEPGIDDVTEVGVLSSSVSWSRIGIKGSGTNSKWLEIFSSHDALSEP